MIIQFCEWCHYPPIYVVFSIFRFGEDESKRTDSSGMNKDDKSNLTLLMATFKHMAKPYQLLIIPLTIWSGLEQGFFLSDFTAGFISCLFGVDQIGWTLITYGVCDALFSLGFGVIMKYTGRPLIYVLGASINLSVIFTLMFWNLEEEKIQDQQYVLFIVAGLWGIADAVWQTQINGNIYLDPNTHVYINIYIISLSF